MVYDAPKYRHLPDAEQIADELALMPGDGARLGHLRKLLMARGAEGDTDIARVLKKLNKLTKERDDLIHAVPAEVHRRAPEVMIGLYGRRYRKKALPEHYLPLPAAAIAHSDAVRELASQLFDLFTADLFALIKRQT